jgi:formate hydrogenlyase subunit 3/multisubunit Na+/H+ antiporter MnhD subunit
MRYWFAALAIAGVVNAAISAAYYLRVVAAMYFRQTITRPAAEGGLGTRLAMAFCAVAVIAVGLFPGPLVDRANQAGRAADVALKSKPAPAISANGPALAPVAAEKTALTRVSAH